MLRKSFVSIIIVLALVLTACGGSVKVPDIEPLPSLSQSVASVSEVEPEPEPEPEPPIDLPDETLSKEEIAFFDDYIKQSYNYGFLLSDYSDVRYCDLMQVFYNGDLDASVTDEDREKFLRISGWDEMYTGLAKITNARMDEILTEKTGYEFDYFFYGLNGAYSDYDYSNPEGPTYYFARGDVNWYVYDVYEGHRDGDKVVLKVYPNKECEYGYETGYYITPKEVVLKQEDDNYLFVSSLPLYEEGIIKEWCYDLTVPYYGSAQIMVYEPMKDDDDITIKLISDNSLIFTFVNFNYTNKLNKKFDSIDSIALGDINADCTIDMVVKERYKEKDNTYSEVFKVYTCNVWGYYYLDDSASEFAMSDLSDCSAEEVLNTLRSMAQYTNEYKEKYINAIKDDPDYMLGYDFINIDSDGIPELIRVGDCEATGTTIMSCSNYSDEMGVLQTMRLGFTYSPGSGILDNCDGHMGYYYDYIYKLENARFTLVAEGEYEDAPGGPDEYGNYTYIYKWNGKEVSEDVYKRNVMNATGDGGSLEDGYDYYHLLSKEEMLSLLNGEYSKIY
ncbi:MAG: hypothetical protein J6S95_02565 [Lachnospiraceae bacterium]|nr:hypothetical protein [Lachnospiraceae bacterium]